MADAGLFIATVVGLVAASTGCSTSANTPSPVSTSIVHETTSPQTAVVGPNANPPTAVMANPTFVGHWHVHGATMDISPVTATIIANNGPCGPAKACATKPTCQRLPGAIARN